MKRKHLQNILGVLTIVVTLSINTFLVSASMEETFRFPAEFEPVVAIWMAWDLIEEPECGYEMIEALVPHTEVKIIVKSLNLQNQAENELTTRGIPLENISFHHLSYYEFWVRDTGPIFVITENGEKKVVDFEFNGYGYPETYGGLANIQEKVDVNVANELGLDVIESSVVSEGGDREFNGLGTMIVNESVELQRNPGMTKAELEDEFNRVLGVTKVIWLKDWLVEDQNPIKGAVPGPDGESIAFSAWGTGGHVDEMARFVDENTILLAEVTEEDALLHPINARNREVLEACYEILSNETDQDGNSFNIIRVPASEPMYTIISTNHDYYKDLRTLDFEDGSVLPNTDIDILAASSYMNFVIANDVVLIPKYWEAEDPDSINQKDEEFRDIIQSIYPDKEIVQINPLELNYFSGGGGGGMHCITQQEPLVE